MPSLLARSRPHTRHRELGGVLVLPRGHFESGHVARGHEDGGIPDGFEVCKGCRVDVCVLASVYTLWGEVVGARDAGEKQGNAEPEETEGVDGEANHLSVASLLASFCSAW